ncbi:MAG: glycosyltransferase family 2 protein [bacterium]
MSKPLISICIPTYNRARFLKECLESITKQFSNQEIKKNVNVFILDNQSQDNTEEIAKKFTDTFKNVKYIKDSKKRNMIHGIIEVASLADGEYVWVFSDDDIHTKETLKVVIEFIKNNILDLIFCNISGFIENKILYPNLLKIDNDKIINNRKELFIFLNQKFYSTIHFYTTLCSNWIVKREIFVKNHYILEKFNNKLDMFPLPSLFFYTDIKFKSGIISKQILLIRGENTSWTKKNIFTNFIYSSRIWRDYYKKIVKYNKSFLPKYFILKVKIMNILAIKDFFKMILIKIFKKMQIYDKLRLIIKGKREVNEI